MQKLLNEWRQYLAEGKYSKCAPGKEEFCPGRNRPSYTYTQKALDMIFEHESFIPEPYDDQCGYKDGKKIVRTKCGGTVTIGYGTTRYPNRKKVTLTDKSIDKTTARKYARHHLNSWVMPGLNRWFKNVYLNSNQVDAIVSVAYNKGYPGIVNTQLFTELSKNPNQAARVVKKLFLDTALGKAGGIKARRAAEAALYLTPS